MHTIIIVSYKEPKSMVKSVEFVLKQVDLKNFKVIVSDPDFKIEELLKKKFKGKVEFFLDPGEGKSYALNLLIEQYYSKDKNDIIITTDGDVFLNNGSVDAIVSMFKDEKIGIACGHPVPLNDKKSCFGFLAHYLFTEMNYNRKKLFKSGKFFETSGYLLAFRNGVISDFPLEACEDAILPMIFWKKGYKIGYSEKANVNVLCPQNLKDYLIQRKRNIKGHMNIHCLEISKEFKKGTTFVSEVFRGVRWFFVYLFKYANSFRTIILIPFPYILRLYVWFLAVYESKFKKQKYKDGWREEETPSTSLLDGKN